MHHCDEIAEFQVFPDHRPMSSPVCSAQNADRVVMKFTNVNESAPQGGTYTWRPPPGASHALYGLGLDESLRPRPGDSRQITGCRALSVDHAQAPVGLTSASRLAMITFGKRFATGRVGWGACLVRCACPSLPADELTWAKLAQCQIAPWGELGNRGVHTAIRNARQAANVTIQFAGRDELW